MGQDPFAQFQGKKPVFTCADHLVLYTLTPGGSSEFANIKLCGGDGDNKCIEKDYLVKLSALLNVQSSYKILLAISLVYVSMMLDSIG